MGGCHVKRLPRLVVVAPPDLAAPPHEEVGRRNHVLVGGVEGIDDIEEISDVLLCGDLNIGVKKVQCGELKSIECNDCSAFRVNSCSRPTPIKGISSATGLKVAA